MPRKRINNISRSPLSEGCLKQIQELFLKPLIALRPEKYDLKFWLELLFHVHERSITEYIVTTPFDMPGRLWILPQRSFEGTGYRPVRAGDSVWVRIDTTMPERIDVECHNARGRKEQIFVLTSRQWRQIQKHLKPAPKRRRKRVMYHPRRRR